MRSSNRINTMKMNARIKQFLGWFLAIMFPFAARGIMDSSKIPMASALIYWLICGILLRYLLERKLPYFRPKFTLVKNEVIVLAAVTAVSAYLYRTNVDPTAVSLRDLILNGLLFAFLNGWFEQLVFANIYDLAGCKIKLEGIIAAIISIILIYAFYWKNFMPVHLAGSITFLTSQCLAFIIGIRIYNKTEDLTIWSVQQIVYNLFAVFLGGFGINMFIHI